MSEDPLGDRSGLMVRRILSGASAASRQGLQIYRSSSKHWQSGGERRYDKAKNLHSGGDDQKYHDKESSSQIPHTPAARLFRYLFQCPRLFKKVCRTGDDDQLLFTGQQIVRSLVHLNHRFIVATDN